jgi:hypothetical protein
MEGIMADKDVKKVTEAVKKDLAGQKENGISKKAAGFLPLQPVKPDNSQEAAPPPPPPDPKTGSSSNNDANSSDGKKK